MLDVKSIFKSIFKSLTSPIKEIDEKTVSSSSAPHQLKPNHTGKIYSHSNHWKTSQLLIPLLANSNLTYLQKNKKKWNSKTLLHGQGFYPSQTIPLLLLCSFVLLPLDTSHILFQYLEWRCFVTVFAPVCLCHVAPLLIIHSHC